jgi:hypothetical protein
MFQRKMPSPTRFTAKKSKVRIPVRKNNMLKKYGFSAKLSARSRHKSLERAVHEYGALSVFRKLNAIAIFNKNKNPELASKFNADKNWVKKKFMP